MNEREALQRAADLLVLGTGEQKFVHVDPVQQHDITNPRLAFASFKAYYVNEQGTLSFITVRGTIERD